MEKYEVLGLLGEGSFGRVYKAKQTCDSSLVALKVISKRGRSVKEIKALRRECEIQKDLHHPNIIQMLNSFETENEIVVITEFAHKELTTVLGKEGYLPEERVQPIVWDLVSALYYLHSHRVLHRDLKPQNILLDSNDKAKLCDFGFARNMSTGTHVLTSIKGTPLYMAPELIEEHPYDHNADLWSLGCIIYELLVGAPPFCTTSILHLIRMIRHEQIQWPTFISENCVSFLKGLLHKNPSNRLTWPKLLSHPFVENHILIADGSSIMPLTRPLSVNTLQVKEQQRKDKLTQKIQPKSTSSKSAEGVRDVPKKSYKQSTNSSPGLATSDVQKINPQINEKLEKLTLEDAKADRLNGNNVNSREKIPAPLNSDGFRQPEKKAEGNNQRLADIRDLTGVFNLYEDSHPIESEEWVVFLQRSIEEVISGEMAFLSQPSLTNIIVSPLRNAGATPKVIGYAANLFSLPFVAPGVSSELLDKIKMVYVEVKLIPNLVYSSKLMLLRKKQYKQESCLGASPMSSTEQSTDSYKQIRDLVPDDLQAFEYVYLLLCHLVHVDHQFLSQFCDSVVVLNMYRVLHNLLGLTKRKLRVVSDLLAILTHVLKKSPENCELVERVVVKESSEDCGENCTVDFVQMLRHSDPLLRERTCYFVQHLAVNSRSILQSIWSGVLKNTLEVLAYDSIENVRNAAESALEVIRLLPFFGLDG